MSLSNLENADYIVMVIYERLAYFQQGRKSWISVHTWNGRGLLLSVTKISFILAEAKCGRIVVCDFSAEDSNLI